MFGTPASTAIAASLTLSLLLHLPFSTKNVHDSLARPVSQREHQLVAARLLKVRQQYPESAVEPATKDCNIDRN